ncbi:TBC domain-containing protein C1778.09 [Taphrina deformans PYCC 5710]|uniref:TBC domain-containing protein C1778.09 n=1 Tax=Taphrina deformans (strain PYCC 5710 / ATCC 11124 / CBS 356.35 / IMI 108563 / JCM 9778 / NBRC 8474) TaxID=1097556 RepID=R4X880_TAPDE|nr:TBC domain-containing protein C1778.09 [Taphrina deformans PYCC 5710]|eukprot:CCG81718.1 TBC domain-containing protein C1778.09 [Taphrina deformans PYCC 5710]
MVVDSIDARPMSPVVFEKIDTLPFSPAVQGQKSAGTTPTISIDKHDEQTLSPLVETHVPQTVCFSGSREDYNNAVGCALQLAAQNYRVTELDGRAVKVAHPTEPQTQSIMPRSTLEDYDDIDTAKVDRYGFYAHAMQRRISDSTVQEVRARSDSLRRKNTLSRAGLKRASMNLGLYKHTDLLETSKSDLHDTAKEVERSLKWTRMAKRYDSNAPFVFKKSNKLRSRVFKGVPDCWRSSAWHSFISIHSGAQEDEELVLLYRHLIEQTCDSDEQIDLDVPRTVSGHVLFRHRHEGGQRLLFRVLHAITLDFPAQGYVQGMASVAATLLCYYTEENAFIMLHRLWARRAFTELYEPGFPHLLIAFGRLETRMRHSLVGRHLLTIGCNPLAWATRWYLTIFHISVPFHTQLRIWDILMYYDDSTGVGRFAVLEATTLALVEGIEELLLGCEFDQAMRILTMPIDVQDDDRLTHAIHRRLQ